MSMDLGGPHPTQVPLYSADAAQDLVRLGMAQAAHTRVVKMARRIDRVCSWHVSAEPDQ